MHNPWRKYLLGVSVLFALAYEGSFAARVALADLAYFGLERDVVFWGDGERRPSVEQVTAAQSVLDTALARRPAHADYLAMQARLYAWQGLIGNPAAADEQFKLALASMRQSLQQRPGNPYSWAQYAEYLTTQQGSGTELAVAVETARTLGPGDPKLQTRMQALIR
ncbi:MAG: hypothetical protein V4603_18380 [Pseudomonadota bacterium]